MKMAPIMTISMTRPSRARPVTVLPLYVEWWNRSQRIGSTAARLRICASYFELPFLLQLDAGAHGVQALHRFGDALNHEQQAGERNHRFVRPQHRAPWRLLRSLADFVRVPRFTAAHVKEKRERREEEYEVRDRVDEATRAHRPFLEKEIGADVRALVQRVGGAEHEDGAVEHVGELE